MMRTPMFLLALVCLVLGSGVSPAGTFAHVTSLSSNRVIVIDTVTMEPVAKVPAMNMPSSVAAAHRSAYSYVSHKAGGVMVLDQGFNPVAMFGAGMTLSPIVAKPELGLVYVADVVKSKIYAIHPEFLSVHAEIPLGAGYTPHRLAFHPSGRFLYVQAGFFLSHELLVVDTQLQAVVANYPLPFLSTHGMAVTPDGSRVYLQDHSGKVAALDTLTGAVVAKFQIPFMLRDILVSADGERLYLSAVQPGRVLVMDTATHSITHHISLEGHPAGMAFTPDGRHLYVTNNGSNFVTVIDLGALAVIRSIDVGAHNGTYGAFIGTQHTGH